MLTFHADGRVAAAATRLMSEFGPVAADEADQRARSSRNNGNAIQFCHWRQVERLIRCLATERIMGTVH